MRSNRQASTSGNRHRGWITAASGAIAAALLAGIAGCQKQPAATLASDLPAGVTALGAITTERSDRYQFKSATLGKQYTIEVVRIDAAFAPPTPDSLLPVVFVTDNNLLTTLVPAMVKAGSMDLFPSMLIVGIGYDLGSAASPAEAMVLGAARRATDFTPSHDEKYLAAVVPFTEQVLRQPWPKDARLGGADAFLAFIETELKPFIATRYPADLADTALIGHSLGGLFTLHVLLASPGSFKRYVALSPAADYGDEVLLREEAALKDVSARLFIGFGSEDSPAIRDATPRLHARIEASARPGLQYRYRIFPGETHSSMLPTGLMSGLRAVFDPPPPPALTAPPTAQPPR